LGGIIICIGIVGFPGMGAGVRIAPGAGMRPAAAAAARAGSLI
jgi:hypothetical protein